MPRYSGNSYMMCVYTSDSSVAGVIETTKTPGMSPERERERERETAERWR